MLSKKPCTMLQAILYHALAAFHWNCHEIDHDIFLSRSGGGHWPSGGASPDRAAVADRYKRCSLDATPGSVRPSELGLFNDREARAFAAQVRCPTDTSDGYRCSGSSSSSSIVPVVEFVLELPGSDAGASFALQAARWRLRDQSLPELPDVSMGVAGCEQNSVLTLPGRATVCYGLTCIAT